MSIIPIWYPFPLNPLENPISYLHWWLLWSHNTLMWRSLTLPFQKRPWIPFIQSLNSKYVPVFDISLTLSWSSASAGKGGFQFNNNYSDHGIMHGTRQNSKRNTLLADKGTTKCTSLHQLSFCLEYKDDPRVKKLNQKSPAAAAWLVFWWLLCLVLQSVIFHLLLLLHSSTY